MHIYSQLFTIKQQLEGAIADAQLELAWGIGMVVWKMNGVEVCHPLITQTVNIHLDNKTMALEVVPNDVEDYLERDLFISADNPGITDLERAHKDFVGNRTQNLSPYDRSSFESILRSGAKFLDSKGIYWAEQTSTDDRTIPSAADDLKVTDTWVFDGTPPWKEPFYS